MIGSVAGISSGSVTARWCRGFVLVWALLVVGLYGPWTRLAPVDRDEPRFAQASRQMLESITLPASQRDPARHAGSWAVPYVQDRPRLNKPPLIYWLQALCAWVLSGGDVLRDDIWMYRVPSLVCAIGAIGVSWRLARSMFGREVAWIAAAILSVCPVLVIDAHLARADELLLLTVVWTQACLWRVWKGHQGEQGEQGEQRRKRASRVSEQWGVPIAFWLGISAGILAKGPITPMIAGLTILALGVMTRRWRWALALRWEIALPIVLACVGPWVWAVSEHLGGMGAYWKIVRGETLGRSLEPAEGHWGPPGYHTLLLGALLWPGSLGLVPGLYLAWRGVRHPSPRDVMGVGDGAPGISKTIDTNTPHKPTPCLAPIWEGSGSADFFLLAWIVPAWVVFELISTKLPHYTLPMYPALAILCARALAVLSEPGASATGSLAWMSRAWVKWLIAGWKLVPIVIALGMMYVGHRYSWLAHPVWSKFAGLSQFGLVILILSIVLWWTSRRERLLGVLRGGLILGVMIFLLGVVATLHAINTASTDAARVLRQIDPAGQRPLAMQGYQEDSLIFLTRGAIQRIEDAQDWFIAHPEGILVSRSPSNIDTRHSPLKDIEDVPWAYGFNLAKGRPEVLVFIQRTPAP